MHPETTAIITTTEIAQTGYFNKKTHVQINRLIFVSYGTHAMLFCVFGGFYASQTQDAEVTKSLHWGVPNTAIPLEKMANTKILCQKSRKYQYHICLLEVVSILRVKISQACKHQKSTSAIARKCGKTSNLLVQLVIGCNSNSIVDEISKIVLSFTIMSKDLGILT